MSKHIKYALVDFDATLTFGDSYPEVAALNMEAIEVLKEFQRMGGKVILGTAREGKTLGIALNRLGKADFYPDLANCNAPERIAQYGADCRKYMADIFIDDRCIDFTGDWSHYRKVLIDQNDYFNEAL